MIYELRIYTHSRQAARAQRGGSRITPEAMERFGIRQVGFWTIAIVRATTICTTFWSGESCGARTEVERVRDSSRLAGDTRQNRERRPADDPHHQSDSHADRVLENEVAQARP